MTNIDYKKHLTQNLLTKSEYFSNSYSKRTFSGYSVYDAFNSPILKVVSKMDIHLVNVLITQVFKRCPINIRPLFFVRKSINPKSLGLALKGAILSKDLPLIERCITKIFDTMVVYDGNFCWGYNWDYYTLRGGTFPKHYPNAITTYFIADSLVDYVQSGYCKDKKSIISILSSARSFFLHNLNRTEFNEGFCFSYSPIDNKVIYNASALITRFLIRSRGLLGNEYEIDGIVENSISFLFSRVQSNGTWYYGENTNQQWIDSFHSEYMLEFCMELNGNNKYIQYQAIIDKAISYYLSSFLKEDGICPYYSTSENIYPINIHSVASMVIFLCRIDRLDDASIVMDWAFNNLYNNKKNSFYFEVGKYFKNRNIYHRWNDSWMYLACQSYTNKNI